MCAAWSALKSHPCHGLRTVKWVQILISAGGLRPLRTVYSADSGQQTGAHVRSQAKSKQRAAEATRLPMVKQTTRSAGQKQHVWKQVAGCVHTQPAGA
jgi:hypothetical protein